jgi:hypothetical protein
MSWKDEFNEKFVRRFTLSEDRKNTNIPNCAYSNLLGVSIDASEIKDFIEALIKETEQRVAKEILSVGLTWGDTYVLSKERIEQLREKYKGGE